MPTYEEHVVEQGEDIVSIAQRYKVRADDIWGDKKNEELASRRKNGNVLLPGDALSVPLPDDPRQVSIATGKRHTFRRKGVMQKLILVLMKNDEPRAGLPYTLVVEGKRFQGTTPASGRIEHPVPPTARRGKLLLGQGETAEEYAVLIGHLDPIDTDTGLRARLYNLGFLDDRRADEIALGRAVEAFQEHQGLKPTGQLNAATRARIVEIHGS